MEHILTAKGTMPKPETISGASIPEYIEIKATDGSTVAFLSPEADGLKECWIDDEQNGTCTLEMELPLACEKWQYLTDKYRIYADDKEFVILNPDAVDKQRDGKKLTGKIKAHESWVLLGKKFPTISNDPQNPNPPWGAVIIVSGGAAHGGFDPGSAGSALSYLLQGTGWTVGTVDVTGTFDLETEKESVLYNINQVQGKWGGILVWDSVNKTVSLRDEEAYQPYTGYQIRYAKNLKGISRADDYDIVTRLYPFGENDLNIANVNGGLLYLDNQSYSTEVLEGVWYNQDIADQNQLKTQCEKQLAVMCKPRHNYKTEMLDLRPLPGYGHETFKRSDMVDLFDEDFGANARVRIIRYRHNVFQPWLCDMELGDPIEKISATVAQTVLMAKFYKNVVKPNESFQNLLKAIINTAATEINGASGDYTLVDGVSTWLERDPVTEALNGGLTRVNGRGLIISDDGGQTWDVAISGKDGVNANVVRTGQLNAGVVTVGADTTFEEGYDPTKVASMGVDADCVGLWHFDGSLNSHKGVAAQTDTYTKLLLHMDGADNGTTFTDECGKTVTRYGAVTKTGTKKFGTAAGYFDGTDDYLAVPDNGDFAFGTGAFTIDCWVKTSATTAQVITDKYADGGAQVFLGVLTDGAVTGHVWKSGYSIKIKTSAVINDGTWHHVTFVVDSGGKSGRIGVDGTVTEGTSSTAIDATSTGVLSIGRGYNGANYFNGYIDELRISKGIARWTSNFTPPGAPYSSFGAGCFGQALNGYVKAPTTGLSPTQGTVSLRAKNLSASANGSVLVDLPDVDNTQGILAGISSVAGHEGEIYVTDNTTTAYGPNKSTLTAWDSISLAWKPDRLSLVVNDSESCFIENPGLPAALGNYLYIGTDRNGANAINTLVDELRIDKVYREVNIRTGWHKTGVPFYTSEDMKQWPGYMKLETDGLKVYDPLNELRVLLGSWIENAVREYGLEVIKGRIYSSIVRSGAKEDKTYIQFTPPNYLEVWSDVSGTSKLQLRLTARSGGGGGGIDFYVDDTWMGQVVQQSDGLYINAWRDQKLHLYGQSGVDCRNGLSVTGNLSCTGSKPAQQITGNYGLRYMYATEAPEIIYYDRGRAQLVNGECTIYLDPIYLECIEPDTDFTPWLFKTEVYGLGENIRVVEWGDNYFKVKEENGGTSNRKFGWWHEAIRKGYAGIRLMEVID